MWVAPVREEPVNPLQAFVRRLPNVVSEGGVLVFDGVSELIVPSDQHAAVGFREIEGAVYDVEG